MSINFGRYEFAGPFATLDELEDRPGLFILLCMYEDNFQVLAVRTAKLIQTEFVMALNSDSWIETCTGKLRVAVYYSSDQHLLEMVKEHVLERTIDV